MDKQQLSESDICDKFIRPAMECAGWNGMDQIYREYPLRAGRVVVRGKTARRDPSTVLRADYALFYKKAAIEVRYEGETFLVVPQSAVLVVVRDPPVS